MKMIFLGMRYLFEIPKKGYKRVPKNCRNPPFLPFP
ncbi:MAG: hypothetical protein EZS26_002929 [Candidatus Ordinivivax streblomastigis]|uniref:Uncharacterized protein n=1 Tax=Candidatus Ordinivivax streblomastigis TaxID=2540710 RepID=A0A5M8NW39_9BACT|nr:MAG: hypothetical protein EZS26_002929 [Candidatus Ordinivivax streblomastigis]